MGRTMEEAKEEEQEQEKFPTRRKGEALMRKAEVGPRTPEDPECGRRVPQGFPG
jgi:hypothetical protein